MVLFSNMPKKERLKQEYLQYVLWFYSQFNGFKNVSAKATIAHLTGKKLKLLMIPLPPLLLQSKFAQIVENVESLKSKYETSLTELENLYGSLSQRAFRGDLDLSKVPVDIITEIKPIKINSNKLTPEVTVETAKQFSEKELI